MGSCASATLVYGYDLGPLGDIADDLPWFSEYDPDLDLAEQAMEQIKAAGVSGVDFDFPGHVDYPGLVLYAKGSARSVDWAQTMALDPALLAASPPEWDARLDAAAAVLGLTPASDGPRWLVFPSYG